MSNRWSIAGGNGDDVPPASVEGRSSKRRKIYEEEEEESDEACPMIIFDDDEENEPTEEVKPIGEVIGFSGEGTHQRNHYKAFDFNAITYELEDTVLLVPDTEGQIMKPYVAIIKYITEMKNGSIVLYVHWFYRPENVEIENAENLQSSDARELFYSSHLDEVPAESILHKCLVHFVPSERRIPNCKEHPGFIVQKVYDHISKRLFKLSDKNYEDNLQHEVDLLVQKTICRLGDLPDIESRDHVTDVEDQLNIGKPVKRKNILMLDVKRENETTNRFDRLPSTETSERCKSSASEYYIMLANSNAFTRDHYRDKWLEKLLEGIGFVCNNNDGSQSGGPTNMSQDNNPHTAPAVWPDAAVSAAIALEKASYKSFPSLRKYNQKMRQLCCNIKKNAKLTRRLLKGELEPSQILTMLPNELKVLEDIVYLD